MTDEIPQAAYAFVDKLVIHGANPNEPLMTRYRTFAARLAHENGLVPKKPEVNALVKLWEGLRASYTVSNNPHFFRRCAEDELTKHNYAVVKVATDEERLIEARELCAKIASIWGFGDYSLNFRFGSRDSLEPMPLVLAALKARDGVV